MILSKSSLVGQIELPAGRPRESRAPNDVSRTFESALYFSAKSIGLSRVGGRKPCTLRQAARHNLREIQAEKGADGHIDPSRSSRNVILAGPPTAIEIHQAAKRLLSSANLPRKLRTDHCQAIEAVFSVPSHPQIDRPRFFEDCLQWLRDALGLPILSAVIHQDERCPHLHVLMLPLKGGQHVGSKPIGQAALRRLREDFFQRVAGPHGLKRQGARLHGAAKKRAISAVLCHCDAMGLPDASGPLWRLFAEAISSNPLLALEALGVDVRTIMADHGSRHSETPADQLGSADVAADRPIEIDGSLSCVGFDSQESFAIPPNAVGYAYTHAHAARPQQS